MDVVTTTIETASYGLTGTMGYHVHNPARPHDQRFGCWPKNGYIPITKGRSSVNSGVFIPGKYRVNPYSIQNGSVGVHHKIGCFELEEITPSSRYKWPGIDQLMFNDYHQPNEPIYLVTVPFVNTYWTNFDGFIVGKTYYQVVWMFGDFWRYSLPNQADLNVKPHVSSDYEQLALQKAYGKIRAGDLPLGESIGELRETIEMLRSPLSALRKFFVDDNTRNLRLLKAFVLNRYWESESKKLLGRTGIASIEAATGTWLELRYGLRPLISLVQDVVDRIRDKQVEAFDPEKIRSVRSNLEFGPIQTWTDPVINPSGRVCARSHCLVEDEYVSSASVQYRQSEKASFLDSLGLTPRHLPEVAWELTRCSFVWDWLISIGPWLASLRINPGVEILGNTVGFKHSRKISVFSTQLCTRGANPDIPWTTLNNAHGKEGDLDVLTKSSYARKVNVELSYLPHFTWGRTLDLYKTIDSLSLIWQFLPQKFKKW